MSRSPRLSPHLQKRLRKVRAFLFDVDGVLAGIDSTPAAPGRENRMFDEQDKPAIREAQEHGIRVGIITSRQSGSVAGFARELAIEDVFMGNFNKMEPYEEFKRLYSYRDEEIGYMGDDFLDMPVLKRVGFSSTPADAQSSIKISVHYVSKLAGGRGAVREVLNLLLNVQAPAR
jgi:3-deoxy-D-manno-octulosonate 8-phosphate phosphatase (KDO 8-P phosphatase)